MARAPKLQLKKTSWRNSLMIITLGIITLGGAIGLGSLMALRLVAETANPQQLYLAPATTSAVVNSEFTVTVRVGTTTPTDGIEATLSYNPSLVQYVSTNTSNSAYTVELPTQTTGSSITISRGVFAPNSVSTDAEVAQVTFRALTTAGVTPISLTGNAVYQGFYTNPTTTGTIVTITDPTPPADTTAPIVSIVKPASGAQAKTNFPISAAATDNKGVVKIEIYADGTLIRSAEASTISYTWSVKSKTITKGEHTITVKAYDAAGNAGTASIKVYKR